MHASKTLKTAWSQWLQKHFDLVINAQNVVSGAPISLLDSCHTVANIGGVGISCVDCLCCRILVVL
jgi:hypothetical protein